MVAEFTLNKRHRDVVQAIGRLNRSDIYVAFVGEGSHRAEVEAEVAQLGLGKTIHFLGFRRDIPALFRAATCATLTSQREASPAASWRPSAWKFPSWAPTHAASVTFSPAAAESSCRLATPCGLPSYFRDLIDNPAKSRAMGAAGRRSMAPYGLPNVLSLHEQLYQRALGVRFPSKPVP